MASVGNRQHRRNRPRDTPQINRPGNIPILGAGASPLPPLRCHHLLFEERGSVPTPDASPGRPLNPFVHLFSFSVTKYY